MEDFILREIDRIGEMMLVVARKLGLLDGGTPNYTLENVKEEFGRVDFPYDLDAILQQENPVRYLALTENVSDQALEMFLEIIFHSDLAEARKKALLADALAYLDGKGYFSFKLHSLS